MIDIFIKRWNTIPDRTGRNRAVAHPWQVWIRGLSSNQDEILLCACCRSYAQAKKERNYLIRNWIDFAANYQINFMRIDRNNVYYFNALCKLNGT